jgi:hypothetical protein
MLFVIIGVLSVALLLDRSPETGEEFGRVYKGVRSKVEETIRQLASIWLGKNGVQSIYEDKHDNADVIVVEVLNGRRPSGLPREMNGLKVIVRRGGPYSSQRFGQLPPGTSPAARMAQDFRATLLAQPGSWDQYATLNRGANTAYAMRMRGQDPGEAGFAMIRQARGGPGSVPHFSRGWGTYWPYQQEAEGEGGEKGATFDVDQAIEEMFED